MDLVVRVFGNDPKVLRQKADEVQKLLADTDGVVNPRVESQREEPTLEVKVDLAAAQRNQMKPGDVRRAASAVLSGIAVEYVYTPDDNLVEGEL